jgi:hypothetical protein
MLMPALHLHILRYTGLVQFLKQVEFLPARRNRNMATADRPLILPAISNILNKTFIEHVRSRMGPFFLKSQRLVGKMVRK